MPKINNSICEESRFASFFKEQARFLRDYLYYKFGDREQAEDIVQEAFVKLWDNCDQVMPEKAKSYLYTVANNLSISVKRHEQVKMKHADITMYQQKSASAESPEFLLLEKEYMQRLESAISKLPDRQREVYLLNRIEKKTYKEIAEVSNVSVKAIEKLMHKALAKIRLSLEDE